MGIGAQAIRITWLIFVVVALGCPSKDPPPPPPPPTTPDVGGGSGPSPRPNPNPNPTENTAPGLAATYTGSTPAVTRPVVPTPTWDRSGTSNLTRLQIPGAAGITRGASSTIIAILDTGADTTHPRLSSRFVTGWDTLTETDTMVDVDGHGTMLAAAIAMQPSRAGQIASVCERCSILPIRVIDRSPSAAAFSKTDERIAAGLRLARDRGAKVALIGLAANAPTPLTASAVDEVVADGVLVIAPAGNGRLTRPSWPARLESVIAVAASDSQTDVPMGHGNGPQAVDVWAPGSVVDLPSTGGGARRMSGSSLSAAYVAGVAGLLTTLQPSLPPAALRGVLSQSAVPLLPGESSRGVATGRVDAHQALRSILTSFAPTPRVADLSIPYADLVPRAPKPGQAGRVRVRVANTGTEPIELANTVLRLWRGSTATWFDPGAGVLEPGRHRWVELPYTAPSTPGADPLLVEIAERPGQRMGPPGVGSRNGNDAHAVLSFTIEQPPPDQLLRITPVVGMSEQVHEVEVSAATTRDVVLLRVDDLDPDRLDPDHVSLAAHFVNAGNTAVTTGIEAIHGGQTIAELPEHSWGPGQSRTINIVVDRRAGGTGWRKRVRLRPTRDDDDPTNDRANLRVASGEEPTFALAYGDVAHDDVMVDAPYRIDTTRSDIPFLVYVAEYDDTDAEVVAFALYERQTYRPGIRATGPDSIPSLWNEQSSAASLVFNSIREPDRTNEINCMLPRSKDDCTSRSPWSLDVVDDDGVIRGQFFAGSRAIEDEFGAWHRVLRVPWDKATFDHPTTGTDPATRYFLAQVVIYEPGFLFGGSNIQYWSTLRVHRDTLPRFAGRSGDRYYDAHFHTIAEGSADEILGVTNPAQSWGAPLVMMAESAYAMGFIERRALTRSSLANKIVTTDHNQFYSDSSRDEIPRDWSPGAGPTAGLDGPAEFDAMRQLLDRGVGEEVAIAGGVSPSALPGVPKTGRHMLYYDGNHVDGPWHGDAPENPWTVDRMLQQAILDASGDHIPAAYPAHPFLASGDVKSPTWRMRDVEELLGLWPYNGNNAFTRDGHPIARGYQIWNMKIDARLNGLSADDYRQSDPWRYFENSGFHTRSWLSQAWFDQFHWSYLMQRGLTHDRRNAPGTRAIRKVYGVGGTDAHGDFNYTRDVAATILTNPIAHTFAGSDTSLAFTSNAWGRVRTYAISDSPRAHHALEAMFNGQSIVTDGPLVQVELDADPRLDGPSMDFDYNRRRFDRSPSTSPPFNRDGEMGGRGPMGGTRTALILVPDRDEGGAGRPILDAFSPQLRFRVVNPSGLANSGGNVEDLAIWSMTAGGLDYGRQGECQLEQGRTYVDDQWYYLPLFPNGIPSGRSTGLSYARAATSRITIRTPRGTNFCRTDTAPANPTQTTMGISNPVWWAVADFTILGNAECAANGSSTATALEARIDFPISMAAPRRVYVQALGANGRPTGPRVAAAAGDIALGNLDGVNGNRLVVTWPSLTLAMPSNNLGPSGNAYSGSVLVTVEDLRDAGNNPLHPVAMVRHFPTCRGGNLCCELTDPENQHPCFGISIHGACGTCGAGCNARQRCERSTPALYHCVDPRPRTQACPGCASGCCPFGPCIPVADYQTRDDHCGGCNIACATTEHCIAGACVPLDDPGSCAPRDQPCGAGETCCPDGQYGHNCFDLDTDADHCGACGHACSPEERCCSGSCVRFDDPLNCGECGRSCANAANDSRCCFAGGTVDNYACTGITTDDNCGMCGRECTGDRSCDNETCT
ncbi:MAG: S8 family serine peptidase [Myxococcota bacterium]